MHSFVLSLNTVHVQYSQPVFPLQVTKCRNNYSFTTADMIKMNDRCEEALSEIFHMSYV